MTKIAEKERLLSARELGVQLGVMPATILAWAANGAIPAIRITPRAIRFDLTEVRKHLAKRAS